MPLIHDTSEPRPNPVELDAGFSGRNIHLIGPERAWENIALRLYCLGRLQRRQSNLSTTVARDARQHKCGLRLSLRHDLMLYRHMLAVRIPKAQGRYYDRKDGGAFTKIDPQAATRRIFAHLAGASAVMSAYCPPLR
jgi:hypothetical protein